MRKKKIKRYILKRFYAREKAERLLWSEYG